MAWSVRILALLLLSGCTAEQMFNSVRDSARTRCIAMPGMQEARCLSHTRDTWAEYQARRAQLAQDIAEEAEAERPEAVYARRYDDWVP